MSQSSESQQLMEALCTPDPLTAALREKIRGLIETMVDAELTEVLAAGRYERAGVRRGYRHGQTTRTITTGLGPTPLTLPRGRVQQGPQTREWHSQLLPRYARRAGAVDAALLGSYLSGTNSRRLKGALAPLWRDAPLSKSAVSRVVGRVKTLYDRWHRRRLEDERIVLLYLDAIVLRVRLAQKVVSVPVLVALGVRADGQKVVLVSGVN
jgi:putative transposase